MMLNSYKLWSIFKGKESEEAFAVLNIITILLHSLELYDQGI